MRTSKRERIITGALELAHRDGFDALTFDALAEHVGLTRGGIIYHFRTKTDLLEGIAAAFQERWRAEALEALGKPLGEASRAERIEALARSVVDGEILPGEVSFMLSATPEAEKLKETWSALRHEVGRRGLRAHPDAACGTAGRGRLVGQPRRRQPRPESRWFRDRRPHRVSGGWQHARPGTRCPLTRSNDPRPSAHCP